MTGLTWLAARPGIENWLFCLTFVRGAAEREVLTAFGADPDRPVPSRQGDAGGAREESVVRVGEAGQWLFVLEEGAWPPMGTRPEVLQRVSQGGRGRDGLPRHRQAEL